MRRISTRSSSKANAEAKTGQRKSSRNSGQKESPTKSPKTDKLSSKLIVEDSKEIIENAQNDIPVNSSDVMDSKSISMDLLDNKSTSDANIDCSNECSRSHTPPCIGSTGNEAPDSEEVDAEKGKFKGINNSQVEENSEIKMNSAISESAEEVSIQNDVDAELKLNESANLNENLVLPNEQIVDHNLVLEQSTITNENNTSDEKEIDDKEEIKTDNVESINEIKGIETEETEVIETSDKGIVPENQKNPDLDDDQAEEGEIRESKSDEESEKLEVTEKVKKSPVKIKLRRDSFFEEIEQLKQSEEPQVKKFKWNPEHHHCFKQLYTNLYKLHINDFKALSPDLKLVDEKDVKLEEIYIPKPSETKIIKKRTISMDVSSEEIDKPVYSKQPTIGSSEDQENTNIIALNRKISIVDDAASKLRPPPSPPKQPVSSVLFISNLVRPFTIKQLKELLERTGEITAEGFWTDRIKSKCYVQYTSSEEAEATRNALHGVNWPVGNGKKLIIEFATEEDIMKAKNPPIQAAPPIAPVTPPRNKTPPNEETDVMHVARNGDRKEERSRNSERERERGRTPTTREWDIGKNTRKDRSRSRSRERRRKHSGRRSITPLEDFIARKQRKLEESVPQKLMDDLFQRTKTMPCIYWQSLSPEEISVKQQQRLSKMEEHKRRLEEISRNRGARDPGRGAYRRRFD
ncbi:hypothetical protein WA026_006794 [Henosepilachna vigintioctopunctata]|uniref:RRM domain-containing protein n=1 Tax=Henosepilachna vigintioctopunctata TaxID=420089 RepID=A0AAW1UK15_9CUCU